MTKISKLIVNSRLGEVNATASNVQVAYAQSGITEDATLQGFIDELTEANNALTLAIDKDKALSELEIYDDTRDRALQDLFYYLQGMSRVPEGPAKEPANRLFTLFQKYGIGIVALSYNEESSKIDSLLADLATTESQAHIAKLPYVEQMIQSIKDAQAQFSTAHYRYVEQLRKLSNQPNASELKPQVLDILNNKLVVYLRGMLTFNPTQYSNFAQELGIIINRSNEQVRNRKKKAEEKE